MFAEDILMEYTNDLYKTLPMKDLDFLQTLEQYKLLPGNTTEIIESKATNAEKVEHFIHHVIKFSLDFLYLHKFFQAIEHYCKQHTNITLQKLADDMKAEIYGMLIATYCNLYNN